MTGPRGADAATDQSALGDGASPAEIDVCAATRRERDSEALECLRFGGRLSILRKWSEGGLAFGDYSLDLDCLDCGYRAELLWIGFECFETCRVQGREGLPPLKVGYVYVYVCDAWDIESSQVAADMRNQWCREAKVVRPKFGCQGRM